MDAQREAGRRLIQVRCGKCHRVIDRLGYDRASDKSGALTAVLANPDARRGRRFEALMLGPDGQTLRLACHRRCGADWRVRERQLGDAIDAAYKAGRREVVLGVDV